MVFRSKIRDSVINGLLEKAANRKYGHYLSKVVMKRVRGFADEPIAFDFPVTALIGPNGGGKTTILGAAACAYKDVSPRRYFAKSGKYDETMQDWSIEYELIDKRLSPRDIVRRTASFRNARWNRDAVERPVLVFAVSRTVPANERSELLRCASGSFAVPDLDVSHFSEALQRAVARILGKDISGFRQLNIDRSGRVTLLTGATRTGTSYSEFHFGAGESSIIRMVSKIESAPDQTLVLIEEIENGLHPVATVRLVEYLIDAADRKNLQVIFTTHSNEALLPLPTKAVWVATQDKIFQGKLDVGSLRAITGQIETKAVVFVEDSFAKIWVEAILRQSLNFPLDHVQVHAMTGDGTAVAMNKYHNANPAVSTRSVCIIDGDSQQVESEEALVFRLPGKAPESYVFDSVIEEWDKIGGKLAVAVLDRFENYSRVLQICQQVRRQNMDPHLLYSQVGEQLGLVPEAIVSAAFANLWAQIYTQKAAPIAHAVMRIVDDLKDRRSAASDDVKCNLIAASDN
ncbi:ATP-dependent nuclease [Methylobacterium sp. SyP6R]|uniref:ATP-dependent nuclease n=1 Tax=Methylobacterium sp. SyP6R TaxID=2718876 RepID=UPI001F01D1D7|nr:AAA family ATPase [Methylobacterium sp. SyP6R]MCF4124449.1 AAA family ATPase [Methylobacterium sp. SyP6R]